MIIFSSWFLIMILIIQARKSFDDHVLSKISSLPTFFSNFFQTFFMFKWWNAKDDITKKWIINAALTWHLLKIKLKKYTHTHEHTLQGRSLNPKHVLKGSFKRRVLKGTLGTFYSIDTLRFRFYAFLSYLFLGRAK